VVAKRVRKSVGYVSEVKIKSISIFLFLTLQLFLGVNSLSASESSKEDRVLAIVEKMDAAFEEVKDYTCDVEQIFYKDGEEDQRYRFKLYFKKEKRIRVDFSYPYSELTLFYQGNDEKVTIVPFRFLSLLKLHYSIENPRVKTPAGRRINQTDMGYFIEFLFRNLKTVHQGDDEYQEERDRATFLFWGLDYIGGKSQEKYRVMVSRVNWLPLRIERYTPEGKPIEVSIIQNYRINTHLEDKLFVP
jgi:outer membrane lipoprotein-sorting protein